LNVFTAFINNAHHDNIVPVQLNGATLGNHVRQSLNPLYINPHEVVNITLLITVHIGHVIVIIVSVIIQVDITTGEFISTMGG
jgi:hypothetical protein